jgi:CheY-like chemotaxis protein
MAKRKLLCVDDDSGIRKFYKDMFGCHGYDVTVAANGREALKLFLSRKVDAVVTDLEMPGMTGTELASRLKHLRPELPVVLVSGSKAVVETPPKMVDASVPKGAPITKLIDQMDTVIAARVSKRTPLRAKRFIPLGSVLASIAIAVFALPRIWK